MNIFIITEDLSSLSSLSGIWGKLYFAFIYRLQRLNLLFIKIFFPQAKLVSWDDQLSRINLEQEREHSWQITHKIIAPLFANLSHLQIDFIKVWETYIAIYLSHQILSYRQAISLMLDSRPERIIVLGHSRQEDIAQFLAKNKNIPVFVWPCLNFSRLNRQLLDWLFARQLQQTIGEFLAVKKSVQPIKSDFLLAASFFRHLKTLLPLHAKLIKQHLNSLIIYDAGKTKQRLLSEKIANHQTFNLAGALDPEKKSQLYHQAKAMAPKNWRFAVKQLSASADFDHLTVSLIQGYLRSLNFYAFPLACLYLQTSATLISQVKPKGIVLVSDVRPLEVCLGLMAKKLRIKSLLVSPNTILSLDAINQYDLADKLTVVGKVIKKQLTAIGLNSQKIHVIGDLRFDASSPPKKIDLHLPSGYKNFLLISFRPNARIPIEEKRAFFTMCYQAIKHTPHSRLLIKPHPTESQQILRQQIDTWGLKDAVLVNNQDYELMDLLQASYATLLTWSMTGFESFLSKTPVIVVNPTAKNYDDIIPYVKDGGALLAKSVPQLTTVMQKLIKDKHYYQTWVNNGLRFVDDYIQLPDGHVADRIISMLRV